MTEVPTKSFITVDISPAILILSVGKIRPLKQRIPSRSIDIFWYCVGLINLFTSSVAFLKKYSFAASIS